jgi:hypothetical protein
MINCGSMAASSAAQHGSDWEQWRGKSYLTMTSSYHVPLTVEAR